jgi:3',5'-cyclic AMP phosphodiesterase CpdA
MGQGFMAAISNDAKRQPDATFLQISDLHFGDIDPGTGDATLSNTAASVVSNLTWFDGLLGHHGLALQQLEQFCADPDLGEKFELIVTGDYSRHGAMSELSIAKRYILHDIGLVSPTRTGLHLGDEKRLIGIPGNHDQWGGKCQPFGARPANYRLVFGQQSSPWVDATRSVGGRKLIFAGIDSDADVGPFSSARVLAQGDFQSQLAALGSIVGPKQRGEIRVLLIHHSWHRNGMTLRMRHASKRALGQFLDQFGFSVLLTGHTHNPLLKQFNVGNSGSAVWELRCGSTTQHDVTPYKWKTLLGRFPSRLHWSTNTLIVHKLFVDSGLTTWEAQVYERVRGRFSSSGHAGSASFIV